MEIHRHVFFALGTPCTLHLYADNPAQAMLAAAAAVAEVERIERKFSRYRGDSIVARINEAGASAGSIDLDTESASLLDYAFACHAKSGGLFDITSGVLRRAWNFASGRLPAAGDVSALLPLIGLDKVEWRSPTLRFLRRGMEMDFGGIGKEYAADRAAAILESLGIGPALVDLGGDMTVTGPQPDGTPWRVGLRDPARPGQAARQVEMSRGGLASSGDYERCITVQGRRYAHILDPRTGWPAEGLASVTVLAECCMVAGSAATIALLKGEAGIAWLDLLGVPYFCVDSQHVPHESALLSQIIRRTRLRAQIYGRPKDKITSLRSIHKYI